MKVVFPISRRLACALSILSMLGACGGGSGSSGETTPAPKLSFSLKSGPVSRLAVAGTSVAMNVVVVPSFATTNTLLATATDPSGAISPDVFVSATGDGTYTLALTSSKTVPKGHFVGTVSVRLCTTAPCNTQNELSLISLPFDIQVVTTGDAWPGDHLTPLIAWPDVADWSTHQGNAAHTGYVPVVLNPDNFSTRWRSTGVSGGYVPYIYSFPNTITSEAGRFFYSQGTSLFARQEFDGSALWSHNFSDLPYAFVQPPAVADGTVYVVEGQQANTYMFGFDAATGAQKFRSTMASQFERYLAPTVTYQGVYTNSGTYGGLYAFDRTGTQRYFAPADQTSLWTPAVGAHSLYIYTGGQLKIIDVGTGAVQGTIKDASFTNYTHQIGGAPVICDGGNVVVANYMNARLNGGTLGNTLVSFDVKKLSIAWSIPGNFPGTPAYAAGVVYVANENPFRLEARDEATGALLWSWIPPSENDTGFPSEVLVTKNMAFVGTNSATYAIDLKTRATVWSYPQAGRLALSRNGILYIQGSDFLTAINTK